MKPKKQITLEDFSPEQESHKYLKKFKKSWIKRFRPTRMEENYEGVDLANYLVALNRNEEAIKLLTFITEQIQFNEDYNIWSPTGSAIILLASLLRVSESKKYENTINRIVENDYYAKNRKKEYYDKTIEEYEKVMEEVNTETQKWSCHILSRYLMALNYNLETAKKSFEGTNGFDEKLLENKITECYKLLKVKLID